jgi:GTP-binding protein
MPQTRFVTKKALAQGLRPIVLVNKVDRDGADPDNAGVNLTFDLFDKLGATDEQLDFPSFASLNGWAAMELDQPRENMKPLFDTILRHVPAPDADVEAPLQLQITALDYSSYVGRIGVGKIIAAASRPVRTCWSCSVPRRRPPSTSAPRSRPRSARCSATRA